MCSSECTSRVVVLTGGAQGIGRSSVEAFLQRGDKVIFGDVSIAKGEDVEKEFGAKYGAENVKFKPCDIREDDDVTALFDDCERLYGHPNILCCVAAIIDEENWTNAVAVNLNGTIRCCYAGIRHMSKENGHKGGAVVIVGSRAGYGVRPFMPVYSATKAGIIAIARNYADQLHYVHSGVQFSVVCPGVVDSPMGLEPPSDQYKVKRPEEFRKMAATRGQPLRPSYVARAILGCTDKPELNGRILEVHNVGGKVETNLVHLKEPATSPLLLE